MYIDRMDIATARLFTYSHRLLNLSTSQQLPLFQILRRQTTIPIIELLAVQRMKFARACHHHHHHLSLNREGRWGTTDDFTTSFLHFALFSTTLLD